MKKDFEIHVGIPTHAESACRQMAEAEPGRWVLSSVAEVIYGEASGGMIDPHDVPGTLGMLATRRAITLDVALRVADDVLSQFMPDSDIRVEVEQVMLTATEDVSVGLPRPDAYEPIETDFRNGLIVRDSPKFEAHFGVRNIVGGPINSPMSSIVEVAEGLEIPVNQAVRFESKPKVVMTTFFRDYETMVKDALGYARRLRKALSPDFQVKLAVERIIVCLEPQSLPSRQLSRGSR